jgi:hypothetical protein
MGETWTRKNGNVYRFLFKNLKETDLLEYLNIVERIILKWILQIHWKDVGTGFILLRTRTSDGVAELLKKGNAPWC